MRRTDFAFANDVRAAIELRTPRTYRLLIQCTLALIACAVVWANWAILDEVTRGDSRVMPSRQTQVIQSLEGGLVEAILVREGAIVRQGDVLMRIDDTNFGAQLGEVRERRVALAARVARLQAEASGSGEISFDNEIRASHSRAVDTEQAVFVARRTKLTQDLDVVDQQIEQRQRERSEALAQQRRVSDTLELLNREISITQRLFRERVVPEIEMLRLQRQAADARGQLEVARVTVTRLDAAIAEARSRRTSTDGTFRAAAEEELAKTRGDLAVVEETIRAAQDRVRRTDLRAPVNGTVNRLNVVTIGAVVQPGQSILEITPQDDTLLVEAQVRPADIAFIRPNQEAVVKISAYDSTIFGSLQGHVERVSPDTITNENGDTFYRVIVRTTRNFLGTEQRPLPIIPGMVGSAEILTGRKTVMQYLLKPIRRVVSESLRER